MRGNQADWSRLQRKRERKREYVDISIACIYIRDDRFTREIVATRATLTKGLDVISLLVQAKASVRSDESIEMCARMIGNESLGCAQNAPLES